MYFTYQRNFFYVFLHTLLIFTFCLHNCFDDCIVIGGKLTFIMLFSVQYKHLNLSEICNFWTICIIYKYPVIYGNALSVNLSLCSCRDETYQTSVTLVKFSLIKFKICLMVFRIPNDCLFLIKFNIACYELNFTAGSDPAYICCSSNNGIFL